MSNLKTIAVIGLLLIFLTLRFFLFYHNQPTYHDGEAIIFRTTLLSEPRLSEKQQKIHVTLEKGENIIVITSLYPEFHYGDTLRITGKVTLLSTDSGENPITVYFPKIERVEDEMNILLASTHFVREKVTALFLQTLPYPHSHLLLGIVFGIKESMPKQLMDDLRVSGVLHVVAASGMNVTMLGGLLISLFALFLKRQFAVLAGIFGILFYAFLAGLEPSILRASIMGILVFSAQMFGRQNLAVYGLCLAGFLILFFNPVLLFDIGFQLSFLATCGLLYIKPVMEKSKSVKRISKNTIIAEDLTTTVAAQAATIPILLANFGTYSLWSIVVNTLVLWTIPILMIVGGVGAVIGLGLEIVSKGVLYMSIPLLIYFEKIVSIFSGFSGFIEFSHIPLECIAGYYLLLLAFLIGFRKNRNT